MRLLTILIMVFFLKVGSSQVLQDTSFEAGINSPWNQSSTNFNSLVCNSNCGNCGGACTANTGNFWAWLGGSSANPETSILSQNFLILNQPGNSYKLKFFLKTPKVAANIDDYFAVYIDSVLIFYINSSDSSTYKSEYNPVEIDISQFTDGIVHQLIFKGYQTGNPSVTNYLIDDVTILNSTGIEDYYEKPQLVIAPNPVERGTEFSLIINGLMDGDYGLKISSLDGKTIFESGNKFTRWPKMKCDFESGVYLVILTDNKKNSIIKKLVVN